MSQCNLTGERSRHRVTSMSLCLWKARGPGSQEGAVGIANSWCFASRRLPDSPESPLDS